MLAYRLLLASLLALPFAVGACGGSSGSDSDSNATVPRGDTSHAAELAHIHGLGVDSASRRLFVATHYGLFQAAAGESTLSRVGESRQDIMGFSAAGGGRLIGSGHPAPGQNLPPNLGLIESRDGGKTWKNLSLLGKADFHVLRSAGRRVYGFNGATGRLMVSSDGGRIWSGRRPPAALFDLAIDPSDSDRIVATTERGVLRSSDAGGRWRTLRGGIAGLLAWPAPDRLYIVDGQGQVGQSTNAGKSFKGVGSIGGQPAAFASHEGDLYAARGDGQVLASADGGADWVLRARP